jgi:hypothetical protein
MNKSTFFFSALALLCFSVEAIDLEKPHHQLGWLGYLKLPQSTLKTSRIVTPQSPLLWKEWKSESQDVLSWLPKPKGQSTNPHQNYIIELSKIDDKTKVKTNRRRARRGH